MIQSFVAANLCIEQCDKGWLNFQISKLRSSLEISILLFHLSHLSKTILMIQERQYFPYYATGKSWQVKKKLFSPVTDKDYYQEQFKQWLLQNNIKIKIGTNDKPVISSSCQWSYHLCRQNIYRTISMQKVFTSNQMPWLLIPEIKFMVNPLIEDKTWIIIS